ncbi:hypothetical protein P2318_03970 [Myxococcaceae bacterium GXIMD 01537]
MSSERARTSPDPLPSRLKKLLEFLTDEEQGARLECVYRAAALAIERLGHVAIVKYEPTTADASGADLSLWETMAPALRDTVMGVNALVAAIRQEFPPPEKTDEGEGWRPPPASSDERLWREVEAVLHACAERLARRVGELGVAMRRPEVVSDGWTLMAELQAFRADFRSRIGDLVYLTAAAFEDVRREEVVPGAQADVSSSASLRVSVAELRRSLQSKLERAARAEPTALPALARQLEDSLAAFGTLKSAIMLRMGDKRTLLELRARLREAGARPQLSADEVTALVEPFLAMLEEVAEGLTREALLAHDRAVWAGCRARLEQATMHLELGSPGAGRILAEALDAAGALYGRDAGFDVFVRKARGASEEELEEGQVRETLERFCERLSGLPFS